MQVRDLTRQAERIAPPRGPTPPGAAPPERSFLETLQRVREESRQPGINLSVHARQRLEQRRISWNPTDETTMARALNELETKGARDALVLRADAAFVVNVPSRTVVTAIGPDELRERIFTGIDSAMMV